MVKYPMSLLVCIYNLNCCLCPQIVVLLFFLKVLAHVSFIASGVSNFVLLEQVANITEPFQYMLNFIY